MRICGREGHVFILGHVREVECDIVRRQILVRLGGDTKWYGYLKQDW